MRVVILNPPPRVPKTHFSMPFCENLIMTCPILFMEQIKCQLYKNNFIFPLAVLRFDIWVVSPLKMSKIKLFFKMWGISQQKVERQGKSFEALCIELYYAT